MFRLAGSRTRGWNIRARKGRRECRALPRREDNKGQALFALCLARARATRCGSGDERQKLSRSLLSSLSPRIARSAASSSSSSLQTLSFAFLFVLLLFRRPHLETPLFFYSFFFQKLQGCERVEICCDSGLRGVNEESSY